MTYRQVQVIGGKGASPGQFASAIRGLAVDRQGRLHAAGDSEVKVFDPNGRFLRQWRCSLPPLCVAVAADGSAWVGEAGQIEVFDDSGRLRDSWRDERLLGRVTAIGFLRDGVLAGDAAGRAIRHFDRQGRFLNDIGNNNRLNGFHIPNGVVDFGVDAHGLIHAANPGKHRVERYTAAGELVGHIGRFDGNDPAGFTGCCNPTNVAIADRIYVTEKAVPRAKAYDFDGKLMAVIAGNDVFDANVKNMSIAAGPRGRVYVADTVRLAAYAFDPVGA